MTSASLTGSDVLALLDRVHGAFVAHRDEIDALNVFPVPDGDTGTNLVFTVRSAIEQLRGVDADELWRSLIRGAMMGARGNSGVIFSQVLRGLAESFAELGDRPPSAAAFAAGWRRARELAYDAVADPLEGTMLSAITAAAEAADAGADDDLTTLTGRVVGYVHDTVTRTRDQLEANRRAGVVDAGARGIEVFVTAIHDHVQGAPDVPVDVPSPVVDRSQVRNVSREAGSDEYRFEVQYLLEADDEVRPGLQEALGRIGDSVVVVAAGGIMNVHVHTNDIAAAIDAGAEHGRAWRIQVTEFATQVAERDGGSAAEREPLGVVAVLPGPGLGDVARGAGALVVDGASGDLPTVAALLEAVTAANAERVLLLPGHVNVVPTAKQVAKVALEEGDVDVVVLEAVTSPPAVLAALAVIDPADPDAAIGAVEQVVGGCAVGEVVAAVRDADTDAGPVRQGQFLAIVDGDIVGVADDPVEALRGVAQACTAGDAELITVVVGADVDEVERARAVDALPDGAEVEVIDGGQRPVRYFLGVE